MNFTLLTTVFSVACLVSFILTPFMRKVALKRGIVSKPGKRRVHTKPVPFLGSLAIYFSFLAGILIVFFVDGQFRLKFSEELTGLLIAGTLIVIVGLCDDIKNIKPAVKLIGQLIAALILFRYGFRIELFTNPFSGAETPVPFILSIVFTFAWVLGLVNAMNLIDGLDGLAAGITVIVCGALLFIALYLNNVMTAFLLVALAGSALGFLRYNFYPAKIFMGDSGSMFIGLVLAAAILARSQYKTAATVALLTPITALVIPLYDTLMAIIRRIIKKDSIFVADKKHLHHRLLEMGLTQKQIVLALYVITLYLGLFAFLFALIPNKYALILLLLLALGLYMGIRMLGFIERKLKLLHNAKR